MLSSDPEGGEIGHQTPEVVLNRIALDLQQLVVEHLLTVDAEVECGQSHQDDRQDDDDDAVTADRLVGIGLRNPVIVLLELGRIVSHVVLFHTAILL